MAIKLPDMGNLTPLITEIYASGNIRLDLPNGYRFIFKPIESRVYVAYEFGVEDEKIKPLIPTYQFYKSLDSFRNYVRHKAKQITFRLDKAPSQETYSMWLSAFFISEEQFMGKHSKHKNKNKSKYNRYSTASTNVKTFVINTNPNGIAPPHTVFLRKVKVAAPLALPQPPKNNIMVLEKPTSMKIDLDELAQYEKMFNWRSDSSMYISAAKSYGLEVQLTVSRHLDDMFEAKLLYDMASYRLQIKEMSRYIPKENPLHANDVGDFLMYEGNNIQLKPQNAATILEAFEFLDTTVLDNSTDYISKTVDCRDYPNL